jgi:serine phosphatase RsbU (regulator of sigma subunit)
MTLVLSATVEGRPQTWPLESGQVGLGRSSRNAVQLADATVSKEHAEILREGERWLIRDLGSRNGTRVNGTEARDLTPLKDGDIIEVGKVVLRVGAGRVEVPTQFSASAGLSSSVRLRAQDILERQVSSPGQPANLVQLLVDAGRVLVLPRPLKETCEEVLRFVEKAVPASRLIILLREKPDSEPVQVAARYRGVTASEPLALSRTILETVLADCASVITRDAALDPRFQMQHSIVSQGVHSAMAVPLFDNQEVLGVLYADSNAPLVQYGQEQLEVLTLLANMAAVKITNARLLEQEQSRQRMAQEMATAARIQRTLLAPAPAIPGFHCHVRLETCLEVGGDLYDFHARPDGRYVFLVGDVSGKGMGAALLMSSILSSARVLYDACSDPAELATRLNGVMNRSTDSRHFVTAFLGCVDPASGALHYVNAGHNAPMLVRGGEVRELPAAGVPIAVLPEFPYRSESLVLEPGDLLAVFTDGIPEAQRGDDFFEDYRLRRLLVEGAAEPGLESVAERILSQVDEFLSGANRTDDITLLLLRRV